MDCSQMENLASAVKAKLSEWQDALSSVSMQNVQQYGAYGWGVIIGTFLMICLISSVN